MQPADNAGRTVRLQLIWAATPSSAHASGCRGLCGSLVAWGGLEHSWFSHGDGCAPCCLCGKLRGVSRFSIVLRLLLHVAGLN
jgi:hypothetical protein